MGFLAIPGSDSTQILTTREGTSYQVMIALSLASTLFSIGSISIGLIHVRRYRLNLTVANNDPDYNVFAYSHPTFGLRILCIFWSLPLAFLLWSLLTFSISICIFCLILGTQLVGSLLRPLSVLVFGGIFVTLGYFWRRGSKWGWFTAAKGERIRFEVWHQWSVVHDALFLTLCKFINWFDKIIVSVDQPCIEVVSFCICYLFGLSYYIELPTVSAWYWIWSLKIFNIDTKV